MADPQGRLGLIEDREVMQSLSQYRREDQADTPRGDAGAGHLVHPPAVFNENTVGGAHPLADGPVFTINVPSLTDDLGAVPITALARTCWSIHRSGLTVPAWHPTARTYPRKHCPRNSA